jgi:hypothetical protein
MKTVIIISIAAECTEFEVVCHTRTAAELYEIHRLAETTRAPRIVHSMSEGLLFQTAEEREMA